MSDDSSDWNPMILRSQFLSIDMCGLQFVVFVFAEIYVAIYHLWSARPDGTV